MNKRQGSIIHHLQTWATELGKDPETLKKALIKSDYRPKAGEPIPLRAIVQALFGEEHVEKVRALRLDNEERERCARERDGTLVEWPTIEAVLTSRVNAIQCALDACPDKEWAEKVFKPAVLALIHKP